jgi:hypothetical protein
MVRGAIPPLTHDQVTVVPVSRPAAGPPQAMGSLRKPCPAQAGIVGLSDGMTESPRRSGQRPQGSQMKQPRCTNIAGRHRTMIALLMKQVTGGMSYHAHR